MAKRLVKRARSAMAQRLNILDVDPKLAPELGAQAAKFFANSAQFRQWLSQHAATNTVLVVGFYKVASGKPSMTWSKSVDQALCFGWIDGVRKRIDDIAYQIRFTPRKRSSIWSAVNIAKFELLSAQGLMLPAGAAAYAHRSAQNSKVYAYEQARSAELSAAESTEFQQKQAAWAFFQKTPPSYKNVMLHWVVQAKKPETRTERLRKLIQACADGLRLR